MSDPAKVYAIRISPDARQDIEYARTRFVTYAGEEVADEWLLGLMDQISHLSANPTYPLAVESALFTFLVRAFPYRRPGSSVTYRVLFAILEETKDGPQVWILHIRHGSAAPMQAYEARNIEAGAEEMGL